jgi:SAM-dependent methyltransferase
MGGSDVLEVGPDRSWSCRELVGGCRYFFADVANTNPSSTGFVRMSGPYRFDVGDGVFDAVFSCNVIEHVPKPWLWLEELVRVIKPGGLIICVNPVSWPYHEAPVDCWRLLPEAYKALFDEAGLETVFTWHGNLVPLEDGWRAEHGPATVTDTIAVGRKSQTESKEVTVTNDSIWAPSTPQVVVVDDFLSEPDAVRDFALRQQYVTDDRYFKGFRSKDRKLWPGLRERFEDLLRRKITRWDEYGTNGVFQWCPAGTQRVWHSDQQTYAGAIYLTPNAPPESGTMLVRSRATRGRTVDESVMLSATWPGGAITGNAAAHAMYEGKLLDATAWETVDIVGNVYGRLALWNARLAHAAGPYFGTSLEDSRLIQLFFFDCE